MKFGLGANEDLVAPKTVATVFAAYEATWSLIQGSFTGRPQAEIDRARQLLADALINAACRGHQEPSDLQQEGIWALRATYPDIML